MECNRAALADEVTPSTCRCWRHLAILPDSGVSPYFTHASCSRHHHHFTARNSLFFRLMAQNSLFPQIPLCIYLIFLDILSSYLGIMPLVDSLLLSQNLVHSMKHFAKNKVEVKRNHARTSGGCP